MFNLNKLDNLIHIIVNKNKNKNKDNNNLKICLQVNYMINQLWIINNKLINKIMIIDYYSYFLIVNYI